MIPYDLYLLSTRVKIILIFLGPKIFKTLCFAKTLLCFQSVGPVHPYRR